MQTVSGLFLVGMVRYCQEVWNTGAVDSQADCTQTSHFASATSVNFTKFDYSELLVKDQKLQFCSVFLLWCLREPVKE